MARQNKTIKPNTEEKKQQEQQELEELKLRMDKMKAEEERLKANTVPTAEYLENIRKTHKDPYWMSYEVVQIKLGSPIQTIFTSEHYYEAFDVFKEYFEKDKHARMDLVVREVRDGTPIFRTIVAEFEVAGAHGDVTSDGRQTLSSFASPTDYGRFGPSVYNQTYKDAKWAGYEAYSRPLKTFSYGDCSSGFDQKSEPKAHPL